MTEVCDVLVVGGGPGGSAAGTLFARRGLRTVVADRAAFPRDKPCSEYMSPEAVRLLDRLGVLPRLAGNASVALRGTSVRCTSASSTRASSLLLTARP